MRNFGLNGTPGKRRQPPALPGVSEIVHHRLVNNPYQRARIDNAPRSATTEVPARQNGLNRCRRSAPRRRNLPPWPKHAFGQPTRLADGLELESAPTHGGEVP